jgi:hypothetical protein
MSHNTPNKSHSAIFTSPFPAYVCIIEQNDLKPKKIIASWKQQQTNQSPFKASSTPL